MDSYEHAVVFDLFFPGWQASFDTDFPLPSVYSFLSWHKYFTKQTRLKKYAYREEHTEK